MSELNELISLVRTTLSNNKCQFVKCSLGIQRHTPQDVLKINGLFQNKTILLR